MMFERLSEFVNRHEELSLLINDPDIIADQGKWRGLMKEYSDITPIAEKYTEYKNTQKNIEEAIEMLEEKPDEELKSLLKDELSENRERLAEIEEELKLLLIPKDPNDDKNVIMEIRGGAGGDEAALFAGSLFRMYNKYAERNGWKVELMSASESDLGGFKEVCFMITGRGAYSRLKYESGVHRVQRVPETESGGRIHTSTVTVAVLPEADEVDVQIDMNDVRIDVFRASGNGGQCVNTTDSAVRVTHIPTGIVVSCQDEKSQLKNKNKALKVLYARLYDMELKKHNEEIAGERKAQGGTGNRNERIRTYNFPQGRVTDHRVNLTLYKIDNIMEGELDEIIDALTAAERAERLSEKPGFPLE